MSKFEDINQNSLLHDPTENADVGQCGSCPNVIKCIAAIKMEHRVSYETLSNSADPRIEQSVDDIFESAKASGFLSILEHVSELEIVDGDSMLSAMRSVAVNQADDSDEMIKEALLDLEVMTMDCDGPIKMRAKKSGRVVTATICNSPQAYDGLSSEEVYVRRDYDR